MVVIAKRNKRKNRDRVLLSMFAILLLAGVSYFLVDKNNERAFESALNSKTDIPAPTAEPAGGFFTDSVTVNMRSFRPQFDIYYTTDGSIPSLSSKRYNGQVKFGDRTGERNLISSISTSPHWKPPAGEVSKSTVLKAAVYKKGVGFGKVLTHTYFVNDSGQNPWKLPVVSLSTDKKYLFDRQIGIYVLGDSYEDKDRFARKLIDLASPWWEHPANYKNRGSDWERPVTFEYYDASGKKQSSMNAGIRIHGNATRAFSQKSLRILFESNFSDEVLQYPLFKDRGHDRFASLILRTSGNDWTKTLMRDGVIHNTMRGTCVNTQSYQPVIVFLNGEYWGIHNIRERYDEENLALHLNVKEENVLLCEQVGMQLLCDNKEEMKWLNELGSMIKKPGVSLEKKMKVLNDAFEMQSFMDYIIAENFYANTDWPANNVEFYRIAGSGERSKYRFLLQDLDYGLGYYGNVEGHHANMFRHLKQSNAFISSMFRILEKDGEFATAFYKRYKELLDSKLNGKNITGHIDSAAALLRPNIQQHVRRWRYPVTIEKWESNVGGMKNFALNRGAVVKKQLENWYQSTKKEQLGYLPEK